MSNQYHGRMHSLPVISDDGWSDALDSGDWLSAVFSLARAAAEEVSLPLLFERVAATAAALTDATAAAVQIVADDGEFMRIEAHVGLSADYLDQVNDRRLISLDPGSPYFDSPSSQAYRTGSVIVVDEVDSDADYLPWSEIASIALPGGHAYRSMAAVPMVAEGEKAGVLVVYGTSSEVTSPERLSLLQVLAEHAAIALTLSRSRARERETILQLLEANESLRRQQQVLDLAENLHQGLMQSMLGGGGVKGILATTAEVMGLDLLLDDQNDRVASSAGAMSRSGEMFDAAVTKVSGSDDGAPSVGAVFVGGEDSTRLGWVVPLSLDTGVVAWLGAFGDRAEDEDLQRRQIERVAMALRLELWHAQSSREVEWRLSGDLLEQILNDALSAPAKALARLKHLGIAVEVGLYVIVFRAKSEAWEVNGGEPVRRAMLSALERSLHSAGARSLIAWRENSAIAVIPANHLDDDVRAYASRIARSVSRWIPTSRIAVVASERCEDVAQIADGYRTCVGLMDLLDGESGQDVDDVRVVTVGDLGVYSVLLSAGRTRELKQLRDRTLAALETYDRSKDAKLIETLSSYLAHDCKAQPTAAALFMHPNTVLYRLKTIERLTGLDLRRSGDVVKAQLALMINSVIES